MAGPIPAAWTPHLLDPSQPIDLLRCRSLPAAWTGRWAADPGRVVLVDADGRSMTAAELEERSAGAARRLAGFGLETGDRVVLSCEPSLDLVVTYVAAHRLGLVVVPMNTAYSATEVGHVIANTTPAVAIVDDDAMGRTIASASNATCRVVDPAVQGPERANAVLDDIAGSAPALIVHTSGTTGVPKGAVLSSANLLASAEAVRLAWRWEPEDRLALCLPLFHLHGLGVGVHGTLIAGASLVLARRFEPAWVTAAGRDHGATMFFGVPTMYHRLVEHDDVASLSSLRLCVSGSAPLPADVHQRFEARCGQRILERYGMTETVMNVSNPYNGERRPGTVGFPLPGVEVRLGPADSEIQLRGPNVFGGYWNDPAATVATFTDDGWFRSGDIGRFDDDGYLSIVGRSKELIISGGYNVYPREVEDALRAHPGVVDAAVVGAPSPEWGETVVAVVVTDGLVTDEEIQATAAARLAAYKRPREIRRVDQLPRNALGKVLRDQLLR